MKAKFQKSRMMSVLLAVTMLLSAAPASASVFASQGDGLEGLQAAVEASRQKLQNPPKAAGKNDPNAWMTNPIRLELYENGGASAADVAQMKEKQYTTVGDVEQAIKEAQDLIDAGSVGAQEIADAKRRLERVTDRLKPVRVYDSFAGVDIFNTKFNPDGQIWYDTCGFPIVAQCGQVSRFEPELINATYQNAGQENPYPEDCWYWVGEDRSGNRQANAAFCLYSSKDLYNWNYRGTLLKKDLPADAEGVAAGIRISVYERPKLMYNEKNKNFVLWAHIDSTTLAGGNNYAAAMAGCAVNDTIDGLYQYQGRSRMHQLDDGAYRWDNGYDFEYPAYNSKPWNAGPFWYEQPKMRGCARDMNVFVDDDGTGYLIYSSEENRTVFISRLNADYTGLDVPNGKAEEGKDFVRLHPGMMREGEAFFKYNGKYYLITSCCTGTQHNTNTAWMADNIFGEWEDLGNVFTLQSGENPAEYPQGLDSRLSYQSQSSNIFAVDAQKGHYILMSDRWGGQMGNLWLPITIKPNGEIEINKHEYWSLSDFNSMNQLRVLSELPDYYLRAGDLPKTLTVEVLNSRSGEWVKTEDAPVQWNLGANQEIIDSLPVMGNAELKGSVTVGGKAYEIGVGFLKVDASARYLIDVGAEYVEGSNLFNNAALMKQLKKLAPKLKNSVADQPFEKASAGNPFGYTSTVIGDAYNSTAVYPGPTTSKTYDNSGFYVNYQGEPWSTIAYQMLIDESGKYTVSLGMYDWWSPVQRYFKIRVSYENAKGETVTRESKTMRNITKADFTYSFPVKNLPKDGAELSVEIVFLGQDKGPEGDKMENGIMLNWLALSAEPDETPVPAPDKSGLKELIDAAKAIDLALYTEQSATALQTALTKAIATYEDKEATRAEVYKAEIALKTAVDGLTKKSAEEKPGGDDKPGDEPGTEMPSTGSSVPLMPLTVLLLASGLGTLALKRRKK